MDVDRIDSIAWPAIVSDLYSGDNSIIFTAFGTDLIQVDIVQMRIFPYSTAKH